MADKPYGDGLLLIVDDSLNIEIWIDGDYIPGRDGLQLESLDQFMRLRKLLDEVDDVAVLTTSEAREIREMIASEGRCPE